MSGVIFTVAQNGDRYQVIMTIIGGQYVMDTAKTLEEAAEKAAELNRKFARNAPENEKN